jgi:creatinine amidohydrolase
MTTRPSRRTWLLAAGAPALTPAAAQLTNTDAGYRDIRKVRLWENTRKEFREALDGGLLKLVIVPTGSTEQHNEHLAMINDTASVTLVAEQAALRVFPTAMVATPVPVGISPHWMDRKGTLTLTRETFLAVVYEICDSLKQHGVKNILILNGHGGNVRPLRDSLAEYRRKLGINVHFNSYWDAYTPEITRKYMESGKAPGHAAEFETSFAMAAFPQRIHWEGVDYEKMKGKFGIKDAAAEKQDEEFAREAKLASTAKGEAMIGVAVDFVTNRIRSILAGRV